MLDYTKLLDVHSLRDRDKDRLRHDFIDQFEEALKPLNADVEFIPTVAESVFYGMMSPRLHYHTPAHILNMFAFARNNSITLSPIEQVAILFHDAIYRPGSKKNEEMSINMMKCLLHNINVDVKDLDIAAEIIDATAHHLDIAVSPNALLVMDLDMAGFSASPGEFNANSALIEKEFYRGYGNDICTLEQFLNGRLKFLTALQNGKNIYRTALFSNKFEKRAQINLKNAILEVTNRIENENVGR